MGDIGVIVVSYNMAETLKKCIDSLSTQSMPDFRLIVIDDSSGDDTEDVVRSFSDRRICYRRNNEHLGIAASRNKALAELKNEKIVFFTDADCYAGSDWIEKGLKMFKGDSSCIAVEGLTSYGGDSYHPRLSEKFYPRDFKLGMCKTYNCAYRIEVFQKIGGFDEENFNYLCEDTDFFYRAKKAFPEKKFLVCPDMRVVHQTFYWSIPRFFKDIRKVKTHVKFIKKHGRLDYGAGKLGSFIISPKNFALALFPPLIFVYLWRRHIKICSLYDVLFILLYIIRAYYYRLLVWYYAFKEKVFVL